MTAMRTNNSQRKLIPNSGALSAMSTKLTDTCGNPSENYDWTQMAAVRREWQQEYWLPDVSALELTLPEIISIEKQVRRELYP